MRISFAPLWIELDSHNISRKSFRENAKISSSTYSKLINNECVTTETILRICNYLGCDISSVIKCVEE